jgi:EF-P beta-lysylation protein EpmB
MITEICDDRQHTDWKRELSQAITQPLQLLELLALSHTALARQVLQKPPFSLLVPRNYAAKMQPGDPHDPLLRQVLPTLAEQQVTPGFSQDPVGDTEAETVTGLLHKYHGRGLLLTTGACAIHCRYCFRQHYTYSRQIFGQLPEIIERLQTDSTIKEVVLSGGDPLMVTDLRLNQLLEQLAQIPQLQRVRIHSRLPIVLPERMTETLIHSLTTTRLQVVMVTHANHVNELDVAVQQGLQRVAQAGILLFNQAVLLRGVNDRVADLVALSEKLFSYRVVPYYLHLLDRVHGAAHFEVPESEALQLLSQLRVQLPGYLVPKLVREVAGMPYKQPL